MTKKVVSFADIQGIRDKLPQMAQQLDVCQRALSDFLEDKRSSFPRWDTHQMLLTVVDGCGVVPVVGFKGLVWWLLVLLDGPA